MERVLGARRSVVRRFALVLVAGLAVVGVVALASDGEARAEPLLIDGAVVDVESFSFGTIVDPEVREAVEEAQWSLYLDCMSDRGFEDLTTESDGDERAAAQEQAAFGSLAGSDDPLTTIVQLPGGEEWRTDSLWGADGCVYQSHAALGIDPFEREAMRQRVALLFSEADAAAAQSDEIARMLSTCLERGVSEFDVFASLDERSGQPREVRSVVDACLSAEDTVEVGALRSRIHYDMAVGHEELLTAWAQTLKVQSEHIG